MFDLELPGLTAATGVAIEQAAADAAAWPVRYTPGREERRWFGIRKAFPHVLEILTSDGQGHVLADPGTWNEDAWVLRDDAVARLAELVRILAAHAPDGYVFRATWAGSPIERTVDVDTAELARLIQAQALNDHTRYRVTGE